tara:strand:+ start:556 stop:912 length:357 start_codon:yes stop_codon:yes gene_type:complete
MNHLALLAVCIVSVEFFIRLKFTLIVQSILDVTKNVIVVIPNKKISDHWKEKVIPRYAFKIMKSSIQILIIFLCIFTFFIIADLIVEDFFIFALSIKGIIESVVFALSYFFFRKSIVK